MNIMRPEEYQERIEPVLPFRVRLVSYRLGNEFYCAADNVDPGAVIARARGETRAEAEASALRQAARRLEISASQMKP
jgi:ribosomal protein L16/L10AE